MELIVGRRTTNNGRGEVAGQYGAGGSFLSYEKWMYVPKRVD
jgi:hypothetical protein